MTTDDARAWLANAEKHPIPLGIGPGRQWRWVLPPSEATDAMEELPGPVFARLRGPYDHAPWLFHDRAAALAAAADAAARAYAAGWTPPRAAGLPGRGY